MGIDQIEKISTQRTESLIGEPPNNKKDPKGNSLSQVFGSDILKGSKIGSVEKKNLSFWDKFSSYWWPPKSAPVPEREEAPKEKPIYFTPVLEAPPLSPSEYDEINNLPPLPKKFSASLKMKESELIEGLSLMSSKTLEEVMFIIMQGQIELEKENANTAEKTFIQYHEAKKLHDKVVEKVKETLKKDEKLAGYFNTGKKIALASSFICAMASFGASIPVMAMIASYGPAAAAAAAALTGSSAYFERQFKEDKAKHEELGHTSKRTDERLDEICNRLGSIAETDNAFKERLTQFIKKFNTMTLSVIKK